MLEAYTVIKAFMTEVGATMSEGGDWTPADGVAYFGYTDLLGVSRHDAEHALSDVVHARALVARLSPLEDTAVLEALAADFEEEEEPMPVVEEPAKVEAPGVPEAPAAVEVPDAEDPQDEKDDE
jgi:hypothetical protein